jgi:hypothetical protein
MATLTNLTGASFAFAAAATGVLIQSLDQSVTDGGVVRVKNYLGATTGIVTGVDPEMSVKAAFTVAGTTGVMAATVSSEFTIAGLGSGNVPNAFGITTGKYFALSANLSQGNTKLQDGTLDLVRLPGIT